MAAGARRAHRCWSLTWVILDSRHPSVWKLHHQRRADQRSRPRCARTGSSALRRHDFSVSEHSHFSASCQVAASPPGWHSTSTVSGRPDDAATARRGSAGRRSGTADRPRGAEALAVVGTGEGHGAVGSDRVSAEIERAQAGPIAADRDGPRASVTHRVARQQHLGAEQSGEADRSGLPDLAAGQVKVAQARQLRGTDGLRASKAEPVARQAQLPGPDHCPRASAASSRCRFSSPASWPIYARGWRRSVRRLFE